MLLFGKKRGINSGVEEYKKTEGALLIDVREINDVVERLYRHTPRLVDDEGHTDATLIQLSLAPFESGVAVEQFQGCLNCGAVVGGEDDEGVLSQVHAVEGL